jgi:hypothetical protein
MENPKTINRFLLALFFTSIAAAFGLSIYYHDAYILLGWLAALGLAAIVCGALALLNALIFAPIIWLMSKFTDKRAETNKISHHHLG